MNLKTRYLVLCVLGVALPYWQFDQAAPNLFTEDFMGAMDQIHPGAGRRRDRDRDAGAREPAQCEEPDRPPQSGAAER